MFSALKQHLSPVFLRQSLLHPRTALSNCHGIVSQTRCLTVSPVASMSTPSQDVTVNAQHDAWKHLIRPIVRADRSRDLDVEQRWQEKSRRATSQLPPPANAYTGRTVTVVDGRVGDAYMRLQSRLSRNGVHKELRMQRRHEKRGVKRRRLRSERWRRLFAHEVRKKVQLVQAIRHRGA